jgi:two-component system cell cycle response regulator DivK
MKSVLIVEDEAISALLLKKMLGEHFEIELVDNSDKCKSQCLKNQFDFIILDINLGADSIDGSELLKSIKNNPNCKETIFIAMTAYAMPDDKEKYIKMGFDHYFSKPIIFDDVIKKLFSFGEDKPVRSNS